MIGMKIDEQILTALAKDVDLGKIIKFCISCDIYNYGLMQDSSSIRLKSVL